ncbi:hypothetical protein FQN50_000650 [Emmonsiellopsis sp. PD_5]|nr:hypothetical protein FQN50_000650 [Emmonsiellopsis sp. PD_5]
MNNANPSSASPPPSPLAEVEFTERNREDAHQTADDVSSFKFSLDGATIGPDNNQSNGRASRPRHRSRFCYLFLFYAIIAIYSWIVLCILAQRPVKPKLLKNSKALYDSARFLGGVAGVLAFPIATAICAGAVIPYAHGKRRGLTLRQTIFLADRSWANPGSWSMSTFTKNHSPLFWLTVVLHLIAFSIYPLQQVLVGQEIAKVPVDEQEINGVADFEGLFNTETGIPSHIMVQKLRYAITASNIGDVNPYIWMNTSDCSDFSSYSTKKPSRCDRTGIHGMNGGLSFGSIEPGKSFISPVLANFNSGFYQSQAPRVNSTILYNNVTQSEFPENCVDLPGSFYAEYSAASDDTPIYSVQACMPANQTFPPWKQDLFPQTISEVLYLSITINEQENSYSSSFSEKPTVFKIQVDTTAGYFDLPNYSNNNTASDILPGGRRKVEKRWSNDFTTNDYRSTIKEKYHMEWENSERFGQGYNIAPLYTLAEALFGNSSFIATRSHHPLSYTRDTEWSWGSPNCVDLAPMASLLSDRYLDSTLQNYNMECINEPVPRSLPLQVSSWLALFFAQGTHFSTGVNGADNDVRPYQMELAFTAAIYLAHSNWLLHPIHYVFDEFSISYDLGADASLPTISLASLISISILLGIFLIGLGWLAIYASFSWTWTGSLDAFVMLAIGAALGRDGRTGPLPPLGASEANTEFLDRTPGWFGDGRPEAGAIGRVELGAEAPIRNNRLLQAE